MAGESQATGYDDEGTPLEQQADQVPEWMRCPRCGRLGILTDTAGFVDASAYVLMCVECPRTWESPPRAERVEETVFELREGELVERTGQVAPLATRRVSPTLCQEASWQDAQRYSMLPEGNWVVRASGLPPEVWEAIPPGTILPLEPRLDATALRWRWFFIGWVSAAAVTGLGILVL